MCRRVGLVARACRPAIAILKDKAVVPAEKSATLLRVPRVVRMGKGPRQ